MAGANSSGQLVPKQGWGTRGAQGQAGGRTRGGQVLANSPPAFPILYLWALTTAGPRAKSPPHQGQSLPTLVILWVAGSLRKMYHRLTILVLGTQAPAVSPELS